MSGTVVSLNISEKKGTIKKPVDNAVFIENLGMEGDAHSGNWHRQVSLLAQESIDKMSAMGAEGLTGGMFAENITTKGLELYSIKIGTKIKIGETVQEVTQIGKECHQGCEIQKKVGRCVMPQEGIFTKVIKGGIIKIGDEIELLTGVFTE